MSVVAVGETVLADVGHKFTVMNECLGEERYLVAARLIVRVPQADSDCVCGQPIELDRADGRPGTGVLVVSRGREV